MDNPKYTVERKTCPKRKKKVTFPGPIETPEPEPTKPSTSTQDNTPVRKLKRKKQEDKEKGEIIKPKKMKTSLKESSTNMARHDETSSEDGKTKNVERQPFPRKKKQKTKHINQEPSESEPSQPSTSIPVKTLKRKRQEDKKEEKTTESKKMKTPPKDSSDAKQIPTSSERDDLITDKDKFEAKYVEEDYFASGGYGSIYEGFRKSDNLPVAIKHIFKRKIPNKPMDDGNGKMVPSEVAIMLMLEEESIHSDGKASPVALLDWYEIGGEILLVMERPILCEDLLHYICSKGGTLQEEEAKIIMKQLIRTAIDLEDRNIFHQDIKTNNILIQTHTNTPKARLIDFGVSCMAEKDSILRYSGTPINAPPEAFRGFCSPGTTTVWQLGVVLYETLHYCNDFSTKHFLQGDQMIDDELSEECQDFFQACLNTSEEQRPNLQDLLHHPWLR
ncbi:serine/threonine-protein kinase pim-1 isoform X2 [Oryzias latipes]|uniref:serine/threonine-protein kinase pim-1 isoform X2 n=1 Tax=Oryzias latipes TaxID=8090 RepID=UPI0009D9FABB|nr:serine/threonine-protein kinase pim-1 isoform X2 [Oryzias latipes]